VEIEGEGDWKVGENVKLQGQEYVVLTVEDL